MRIGEDRGEAGDERGHFLPRWVVWLALPAIAMPLAIFAFVLTTESAHDPARCPFSEVSRRALAPEVVVVEEGRNCVGDVVERRWTLTRAGRSRVLGNRRLGREAFGPGHSRWSAELSVEGEVRIVVENEGHGRVLFREGTPAERTRDGR